MPSTYHGRIPSGAPAARKVVSGRPQSPAQVERAQSATVSFIRRTLCKASTVSPGAPESSVQDLLPPLSSSNEVDLELYAILAVIIGHFVQPWYTKITPDADLTSEVVQIVAHCTRALEDRWRKIDAEVLLLDEIPLLIDGHIKAVKLAQAENRTVQGCRPSVVVHALYPHPALDPVPENHATEQTQAQNENDWCRVLFGKILPLLIPPEDFSNPCFNTLTSELFSHTIFYNAVFSKITEPWFLLEIIIKAMEITTVSRMPDAKIENQGTQHSEQAPVPVTKSHGRSLLEFMSGLSWSFFRILSFLSLIARLVLVVAQDALRHEKEPAKPQDHWAVPIAHQSRSRQPVVRARLWQCISNLLSLQERMPWLVSCVSLLQRFLIVGRTRLCDVGGAGDRFLRTKFQENVIVGMYSAIPTGLRTLRSTLFPNNNLASQRALLTEPEMFELKRKCCNAILAVVPSAAREIFFATSDEDLIRLEIQPMLELLSNQYINKHLFVALIDLLAVRLCPELHEIES